MSVKIVPTGLRNTLGEGPAWDERRQELIWVDIMGEQIHRLDLASGMVRSVAAGQPVGWALPRRDHDDVIAGLRDGFAIMDLDSGAIRPIGNPEPEHPDNRMNDAKVDRWGRIWAGTKNDVSDAATGALYRLDPDLSWQRMDDNYGVTNGPTFSPDGRIMYHTDSAARVIHAFDLHEDGALGNKRVWLRFPDAWGYPDGMTTDAQGHIWVAHWDGGCISRFTPDGERVAHIPLPASNITSCTFAGPNLDRLFVTSSTLGREGEALAGALFEVSVDTCGLPAPRFAG